MNDLAITGMEPETRPGAQAAPRLRLGNVDIDLANFEVTVGRCPIQLTYQEFELLRHLAGFRDRIVSFDILSNLLWDSAGQRETRRLNVLVCRLRGKLRDSAPYRLETVRGRGYGLLGRSAGDTGGGPGEGGAT